LKRDAATGFALVKGRTVPVNASMVIFVKGGVRGKLTCELSTGQGHADNYTNIFSLHLFTKQFRRALPKHIEYNLNRIHVYIFNGFKAFFYFFHTNTKVLYFSLIL